MEFRVEFDAGKPLMIKWSRSGLSFRCEIWAKLAFLQSADPFGTGSIRIDIPAIWQRRSDL
jgi:hypothetical protein